MKLVFLLFLWVGKEVLYTIFIRSRIVLHFFNPNILQQCFFYDFLLDFILFPSLFLNSLSFPQIQQIMQSARKSQRRASKCSAISNIFHPLHISRELKEIIPLPILKKVQKTQQISCGALESFPQFEMASESEGEVSSCIRAIQYQLNLQGQPMRSHPFVEEYARAMVKQQKGVYNRDHIDASTKESLEDEKEKLEWRERIDEEREMWSDRIFMEKLNDFLGDENSCSQAEGFFIQCDGFLAK